MNDTIVEQQRMATLLHSPDLYNECRMFNDTSWTLDANKWLWRKITEHYVLHNNVPSINILSDYCESNKTIDPVTMAAVKTLLDEYQKQSPQDHTYFRDTLLANARDTTIRETLFPLLKEKDWLGVKAAIDAAQRQSTKLPSKLDLKALMTKPSNDNQCLLNEWAFERQAILAIVAPTGFGKSVMTMQLSTHFACGKSVIGFNPHKAYKVLVIQNEDSDNDIALMRDGSMSQLNEKEKALVYDNLVFIRLRGSAGDTFLTALDMYCGGHKPDIVFVNPLLKYYGGDPMNVKEVSTFLNKLEPILEKHNCGLVLIHHTIKQNKTSRMNPVDSSYAGFGSGVWSNSVRDTIEIRLSKLDGYYKLLAGKRAGKWGWRERYIKRSDNSLLPYWGDVADDQIQQLETADKSNVVSNENKDTILSLIQPLPLTITITELVEQTNIGEKTVRNHIKSLMLEKKIAVSELGTDRVKKYFRPVNDANN